MVVRVLQLTANYGRNLTSQPDILIIVKHWVELRLLFFKNASSIVTNCKLKPVKPQNELGFFADFLSHLENFDLLRNEKFTNLLNF